MSTGTSGYLTVTAPAVDLAKLFTALAEVAGEIQNPAKSAKARIPLKAGGSFEFAYAPLDAILSQTRPLLAAHGLSVIQYPVDVGERAGVQTWLVHSAGGAFNCGTVSLPVGDDPKALGAAITYLRRYAYCAALNIAADDDNDVAPMQTARKKSGGATHAATTGPAPFQRRPQDPRTPGPSVEGDPASRGSSTSPARAPAHAPEVAGSGPTASPAPGSQGRTSPSTSSEPVGDSPGGRVTPAGEDFTEKLDRVYTIAGGSAAKVTRFVKDHYPAWLTDPERRVGSVSDLKEWHLDQILEDSDAG